MSVTEYKDSDLVKRAIRGSRPSRQGEEAERWVCVMDTFGLGSTYATELCRVHGIDPHEKVTSRHMEGDDDDADEHDT